jgi:NifU-like protein involved in Fe-S cluster formation
MLSSTVQAEAAAPYHLRAMPDADLVGQAGAAGQGPYLQLFVKVEGERVLEAAYQTYTCPNAIACGSWVTRWMEGRAPDVLARLEAEDLIRVLGGLPLGKEHCAYLAVHALKEIVRQWPGSEETAGADTTA